MALDLVALNITPARTARDAHATHAYATCAPARHAHGSTNLRRLRSFAGGLRGSAASSCLALDSPGTLAATSYSRAASLPPTRTEEQRALNVRMTRYRGILQRRLLPYTGYYCTYRAMGKVSLAIFDVRAHDAPALFWLFLAAFYPARVALNFPLRLAGAPLLSTTAAIYRQHCILAGGNATTGRRAARFYGLPPPPAH